MGSGWAPGEHTPARAFPEEVSLDEVDHRLLASLSEILEGGIGERWGSTSGLIGFVVFLMGPLMESGFRITVRRAHHSGTPAEQTLQLLLIGVSFLVQCLRSQERFQA